MIRQLIIPGIIAAAAHATLLIPPAREALPPADAATVTPIVIDLPQQKEEPVAPDDPDRPPIDLTEVKFVPEVQPTITMPNEDNPFRDPIPLTMPNPNLKGENLMSIPVNYITGGAQNKIDPNKVFFRLDQLDNRPRTIFQTAPEYPYTMKGQGISGEVTVNFTVDENGVVQDVRVVKSTHPEFEGPTIRAVSKWRFEPGRKNGKRVGFKMSVPVAFSLNEET